jgi:ABC-type cobalamin/Fe3+-siderophores transport system ATPase subunit
LTPALLEAVFGVQAHVIADPQTGAPVCLPFACLRKQYKCSPGLK